MGVWEHAFQSSGVGCACCASRKLDRRVVGAGVPPGTSGVLLEGMRYETRGRFMQIFRGVCFRFDCRPQMEPPNTILLEDPAQATFIRRDTFSRNTVFLEYPAQATFFPQDRIFPQDTFPPAGSMAELCKLLLSIDFYLCTVSFRESSTAQPPPHPSRN